MLFCMNRFRILSAFLLLCFSSISTANTAKNTYRPIDDRTNIKPILPGAYQVNEYFPLLRNKNVGVFANQTSVIGNTHLIDTLVYAGIKVTKVFSPEHGFRGKADAGEKVDSQTTGSGIPVISLYGKKLKPSAEDVENIDVLVFDIQDVGVRFYTYISSLEYFIEAAMEYGKPLIVLDRPNPNGFYVDGPVLQPAFKSFVGMQPIPVVHGMTIGEYAQMLVGEKWINVKQISEGFSLTVIRCKHYSHADKYILPVAPSPNLKEMGSVYWYPSTCFFEGTVLSEGRGTDHPFQIFGHPALPDTLYRFIPRSMEGAKDPKWKDQVCFGWNLSKTISESQLPEIQIGLLLKAYRLFPDKPGFFLPPSKKDASATDYFFNKLAGNDTLMLQIKSGATEADIRKSWESDLARFKKIRKQYLLYDDF